MQKITPARVGAVLAALPALIAAVATFLGAVDSIEKAIVVSVAIIVAGAAGIVWLLGWQKHEARTSGSAA